MNKAITKILRWIILLPASLAAPFAAYYLFLVFNFLFSYSDESILSDLYNSVMSNGISGVALSLASYYIAPSNKNEACIAMTAIWLLLMGASFFYVNFITHDYFSNLGLICSSIGSIGACIYAVSGELKK